MTLDSEIAIVNAMVKARLCMQTVRPLHAHVAVLFFTDRSSDKNLTADYRVACPALHSRCTTLKYFAGLLHTGL
jgi:hypothetical protein